MKKILTMTGILITTLTSSSAFSQYTYKQTNPGPVRLSIGTDAGLPVGALRNRYEWSTGAYGQIEIPVVSNKLAMIGSTGYTRIFAKSNKVRTTDLELIPLRAGLKYFPLTNNGLYLQAQAGAAFVLNKTRSNYDRSTVFTYSPQIGYQFPLGASYLDAGIRWEGNGGYKRFDSYNNTFGFRLAYNFSL